MTSIQDNDGVSTKTEAFNFLKSLLGIRKKDLINKELFNLCFKPYEHWYLGVKDKRDISFIFSNNEIKERNKKYWELKSKDPNSARVVRDETLKILKEALTS